MVRKFLTIPFFLLGATSAIAQYLPNNSQAFHFMPLYNPAFIGVEAFPDLKVSYRYQWSGYGSAAPKFLNLGFTMRLKQPLDLTYNAPRTSHSSALAPSTFPKGKTLAHGLGVNVFSESYGTIQRTGAGLGYGFNLALSKRMRLAIGASAVIENQKVNMGSVTVQDPDDPYYRQLLQNGSSMTALSARGGFLLYSKSFYFGASYLPLVNTAIQTTAAEKNIDTFYKASAQVGFSVMLNPEFVLKPSVIALLQADNKIQIDYSIKTFIREKLWLGFTYRDIESVVPMAGFTISDALSASYSYEISTSDFKQFSDGSHELVLAVRFNNFKKLKQYTW